MRIINAKFHYKNMAHSSILRLKLIGIYSIPAPFNELNKLYLENSQYQCGDIETKWIISVNINLYYAF